LRPGGTLILREVDDRRNLRSFWTRWFERVGASLGVNNANALAFRSRQSLADLIVRCGMTLSNEIRASSLQLDNVLIVATKPALTAPEANS
jgi:hypothetical protein